MHDVWVCGLGKTLGFNFGENAFDEVGVTLFFVGVALPEEGDLGIAGEHVLKVAVEIFGCFF